MWRSGGYVLGRGVFLGNLLHEWAMLQGLPVLLPHKFAPDRHAEPTSFTIFYDGLTYSPPSLRPLLKWFLQSPSNLTETSQSDGIMACNSVVLVDIGGRRSEISGRSFVPVQGSCTTSSKDF